MKNQPRMGKKKTSILHPTILLLTIIILILSSSPPGAYAQQGEASPGWRIVVEEPRTPYTVEELEAMLNQAYAWLVSQGLEPAPPCNGREYIVRITREAGGPLAGLTNYHYSYYPSTGRVADVCIQEILLGLYEDPESGNTRDNLGPVYDLEARMTIVHELSHAAQAGMLEYVWSEESLAKMMVWVEESSSSAVEYFYVGFLDAYMTTGEGYTTTIYSRLAENIINYFSGALYRVNPFEYSLQSYDGNYERLYNYAPLFIWLFEQKGFSALRAFYNTSTPSESPVVKRLIGEFLHALPKGFVYKTENKTIILLPQAQPVTSPTFSVSLEPLSATYLELRLSPGLYGIVRSNNAEDLSHSLTYRGMGVTIYNPSEAAIYPGDWPVLAVVNLLETPVEVAFSLEHLSPVPGEAASVTVTMERTRTVTETQTETLEVTQTRTVERTLTIIETLPPTTVTVERPVTITSTTTLVTTLEPPPRTLTLTKTATATLERTITTTVTAIGTPLPVNKDNGTTVTTTSTVTVTATSQAKAPMDARVLTLALLVILAGILAARVVSR